MTEVNGAEWLMAVDAHPDTLDNDLIVATAMANDGVIGLEGIEGISTEEVNDSVEELIALGFLDDQFSLDHGGAVEHVLELRMPGEDR